MKDRAAPPLQVLIVEDESPIRQLLHTTLRAEGYAVHEAGTAREGEAIAHHRPIDIFLVDLGLPDDDGVALILRLRTWTRRPIIVLSARAQEHDKVKALDAGADDFLGKPFGVAELHARLRVARRNLLVAGQDGRMRLKLGGVEVDLKAKTITRAGQALRLTATQWRLLEALGRHAGSVVTSGQLLREVWGPGHAEQGHYLRIYIRQLRQRLEDDPSHPRFLVTEAGTGYRLLVDALDDPPGAAVPPR
jgi:two-component system, OmpR family, KDP operon response regulator KdpE